MVDTRNLRKRGNSWHFRKLIDGKRVSIPLETSDLSTARKRRDAIVRDMSAHRWRERRDYTIEAAVSRFKAERYPMLSRRTVRNYDSHIRSLEAFFGPKVVMDITRSDLIAFETQCREDGLSGSRIIGHMHCLSAIMHSCIEWEWIDHNIVPTYLRTRRSRGLIPNPARERRLTQDEFERICAAALLLDRTVRNVRNLGARARNEIQFARDTGLRYYEQFSLTWDDVNLGENSDEGYVIVRKEVSKSKRERWVPLWEPTRLMLIEMDRRRDLDCNIVFPNSNGTAYAQDSPVVNERFKRLAASCGITDVHWHDLRRTCGCILLEEGVSMEGIKEWLGHSSTKITERHYAFMNRQDILTLRNRQQEKFGVGQKVAQISSRFLKNARYIGDK